MKNGLFFITALFIFFGSLQTNAQSAKDELDQLIRDDSIDVNTIAIYPQDVRKIIFKVSLHPEGIVKISDAQKKSNEAFRSLVSTYSQEDQEKMWNLMRYNNLIAQLVKTKSKKKKVEEVLKNYPSEIKNDAIESVKYCFERLIEIDKENKKFNASFQAIISGYSNDDQLAFRDMLNTPEAISMLSENMHLTVLLGDIYKTDSTLLFQQFDSLNLVLAEEKAREAEEWKQEMNQNPDAQQELKQSADEFAKENCYNEKDCSNSNPEVIEHYVYIPYPYWCGYPWWYEYEYWYPYPYWYHWGFYISNGEMIWIGSPSWYFIYWHFHHPPNFYHYPHITNAYIDHYYYGPRSSLSGNTIEVRNWMIRNETYLPGDFKSNYAQRIDRLREFGKAEMDRDKFNRNNHGKNVTHDDFIRQHTDEYPHLKQQVVEDRPAPSKQEVKSVEEKPGELLEKDNKTIHIEKSKSGSPSGKKELAKPKQDVHEKQRITPKQIPSKQTVPNAQPRKEQIAPPELKK